MWIKHVLLEIAVTIVIALAAIGDLTWARWIVLIYTPFLLLMKVGVLFGSGFLRSLKGRNDPVPTWFWHTNYAVNVILFLAGQWWLLAAGWGMIWMLSAVHHARTHVKA